MIAHTVEQRSDAWFRLRVGKITASQAAKMLAVTKTGWSVQRQDLKMQIACEMLTGCSCQPHISANSAMQRGVDLEGPAIGAYECHQNTLVERGVGFFEVEGIAAGCSPDGVAVGQGGGRAVKGLIEVKCPTTKIHLEYLRSGIVPAMYEPQLLHSLWVAGPEFEFIDFFSFDDRLPEGLRTFWVREWRDEARIQRHADAVSVFLDEVQTEIAALLALRWEKKYGIGLD